VRIDLGVVEMSLLLLHASRSRMRLPKPCDRSCDDQSQIYTNEKAQCGDQSIHSPRDDHYQHAKPGILRARKYRKWLKRCGEQPRLSNSELQPESSLSLKLNSLFIELSLDEINLGQLGSVRMSDVIEVRFVCVHNAGRSQMAEALLQELGGPSFEVASAGFEPRPVNPIVVEAMKPIGIDISGAKSKSVFELFRTGRYFNYVVTVCDESSAERCPIFPGMTHRLGWSFEDPSGFKGTHDQKLAQVIRVRDEIQVRIETWLKELPHLPKSFGVPIQPAP